MSQSKFRTHQVRKTALFVTHFYRENALKKDDSFLESDCDEQLLLTIPFQQKAGKSTIVFIKNKGNNVKLPPHNDILLTF